MSNRSSGMLFLLLGLPLLQGKLLQREFQGHSESLLESEVQSQIQYREVQHESQSLIEKHTLGETESQGVLEKHGLVETEVEKEKLGKEQIAAGGKQCCGDIPSDGCVSCGAGEKELVVGKMTKPESKKHHKLAESVGDGPVDDASDGAVHEEYESPENQGKDEVAAGEGTEVVFHSNPNHNPHDAATVVARQRPKDTPVSRALEGYGNYLIDHHYLDWLSFRTIRNACYTLFHAIFPSDNNLEKTKGFITGVISFVTANVGFISGYNCAAPANTSPYTVFLYELLYWLDRFPFFKKFVLKTDSDFEKNVTDVPDSGSKAAWSKLTLTLVGKGKRDVHEVYIRPGLATIGDVKNYLRSKGETVVRVAETTWNGRHIKNLSDGDDPRDSEKIRIVLGEFPKQFAGRRRRGGYRLPKQDEVDEKPRGLQSKTERNINQDDLALHKHEVFLKNQKALFPTAPHYQTKFARMRASIGAWFFKGFTSWPYVYYDRAPLLAVDPNAATSSPHENGEISVNNTRTKPTSWLRKMIAATFYLLFNFDDLCDTLSDKLMGDKPFPPENNEAVVKKDLYEKKLEELRKINATPANPSLRLQLQIILEELSSETPTGKGGTNLSEDFDFAKKAAFHRQLQESFTVLDLRQLWQWVLCFILSFYEYIDALLGERLNSTGVTNGVWDFVHTQFKIFMRFMPLGSVSGNVVAFPIRARTDLSTDNRSLYHQLGFGWVVNNSGVFADYISMIMTGGRYNPNAQPTTGDGDNDGNEVAHGDAKETGTVTLAMKFKTVLLVCKDMIVRVLRWSSAGFLEHWSIFSKSVFTKKAIGFNAGLIVGFRRYLGSDLIRTFVWEKMILRFYLKFLPVPSYSNANDSSPVADCWERFTTSVFLQLRGLFRDPEDDVYRKFYVKLYFHEKQTPSPLYVERFVAQIREVRSLSLDEIIREYQGLYNYITKSDNIRAHHGELCSESLLKNDVRPCIAYQTIKDYGSKRLDAGYPGGIIPSIEPVNEKLNKYLIEDKDYLASPDENVKFDDNNALLNVNSLAAYVYSAGVSVYALDFFWTQGHLNGSAFLDEMGLGGTIAAIVIQISCLWDWMRGRYQPGRDGVRGGWLAYLPPWPFAVELPKSQSSENKTVKDEIDPDRRMGYFGQCMHAVYQIVNFEPVEFSKESLDDFMIPQGRKPFRRRVNNVFEVCFEQPFMGGLSGKNMEGTSFLQEFHYSNQIGESTDKIGEDIATRGISAEVKTIADDKTVEVETTAHDNTVEVETIAHDKTVSHGNLRSSRSLKDK